MFFVPSRKARVAPVVADTQEFDATGISPSARAITTRLRLARRLAQRPWHWLTGATVALGAVLAATVLQTAQAADSGAPAQAAQATSGRAGTAIAPRTRTAGPNIAFYYGANPPVGELQAFDAVVLDPAIAFDPLAHPLRHTLWLARVGAGSERTGAAVPDADGFVTHEIAPLWQRGFRGFTVDASTNGSLIQAIHQRYPEAKLIATGPNAVVASTAYASTLYAVVGDSLFTDIAADGQGVAPVSDTVREQRTAAAKSFTASTGVPVVDIERCDASDRACERSVAQKVVALGMTPYVSNAGMDRVGIGRIEVMPRKVLVMQERDDDAPLDIHSVATPLNYLGYDVEYANIDKPLPPDITPDRYAGVVVWIDNANVPDVSAWRDWLSGLIQSHIPVAVFGRFGFDVSNGALDAFGLQSVRGPFSGTVTEPIHDPMIGFEMEPVPDPRNIQGLRIMDGGQSLLQMSVDGTLVDQAGIMPWGGFALTPFTIVSLDGIGEHRWAINPISFLTRALRLQPLPSPSVTTENGLRLMMTHVDGDGYASRAEFPGPDYSGQALYDQIFSKYKIPMLLSVIEGEVGMQGLYPAISPRLEQLARQMFALPNVEIGSHTYAHTFEWDAVDRKTGLRIPGKVSDANFSLVIPGYTFNLDREIAGSIHYINDRLAPPGKHVEVLQWPGDCQPPAIAVRMSYQAGVLNFNGGDTNITKTAKSWTNIAPYGVDKGPGAYQIYAPNQDENVYTNDWQGPYYGFTRVLETFAMTDEPLRFKPIDIYYHMYSGTKEASLHALREIFDAVLKQPVSPVYVTEYIHKVLDWRTFAVARYVDTPDAGTNASRWLVRGNGAVRELHWQAGGAPALQNAQGVSGYAAGPDGIYIHIPNGEATFTVDSHGATPAQPYIDTARGFVEHFEKTPDGMQFAFAGHYQPYIRFNNAQQCSVRIDGRAAPVTRDGRAIQVSFPAQVTQSMQYAKVELHCGS